MAFAYNEPHVKGFEVEMQAIILAAGRGKRLGDLTKNSTKCMVKVNGACLLERMLDQLSALHLTRIVLVIGYCGKEVREFAGDRWKGTPIALRREFGL